AFRPNFQLFFRAYQDTCHFGCFEIREQFYKAGRCFVNVTLIKKDKGKKSRCRADPKPIGSRGHYLLRRNQTKRPSISTTVGIPPSRINSMHCNWLSDMMTRYSTIERRPSPPSNYVRSTSQFNAYSAKSRFVGVRKPMFVRK